MTIKRMAALVAGAALLVSVAPAGAQAQARTSLGPYGYGSVKLGMSAKDAKATGKISLKMKGQCSGWDLKAHPTGRDSVGVYISKNVGVALIFAQKGMKTPEGIGLGSTKKQLKAAYPHLKTAASGYPYTEVPGNKKAYYSFLLSKGKVYELALGLTTQDCVN
ncbi:hypothetical protein ACIBG8_52440 [Nonomuraea sp. NPDC050556]|uniref:hypothetical protein n=1 Tax=Nonomuraea sp. NPDC050556 TaxID=3364369 RepID=UPI003791B9F7